MCPVQEVQLCVLLSQLQGHDYWPSVPPQHKTRTHTHRLKHGRILLAAQRHCGVRVVWNALALQLQLTLDLQQRFLKMSHLRG
jgi:hypothetical protein